MIFVTVGAQMPFDRLVRIVDEWAGRRGRTDVFAQIGDTPWRPAHLPFANFLNPSEFREKMAGAKIIVAHAGMGTILTALELRKPILVFPRRGSLKETRNDHQIATAVRFKELGRLEVAMDEAELLSKLDSLDDLLATEGIGTHASPQLLEGLRRFLEGRHGVRMDGDSGPSTGALPFDGIICFGGEDWWYHNRGHYDMQMMRELSESVPVLYVNSVGMRLPSPSEGRMFFRRVLRKVKSFTRGLRVVRERFGVFSPITIPTLHASRAAGRLMAMQVKRAARRMGIASPLLWVACPPAAHAAASWHGAAGLLYQRTDRYECYPGVPAGQIARFDQLLKESADLTLFCSRLLFEEEKGRCRQALFCDHGVDFQRFVAAGMQGGEALDVKDIPRPRVGFVGGIDAHTFDPRLFLDVASRLPELSFVMVGSSSLPPHWCRLPNVHLLGQRPYEQVPVYMASCDVLIMPWNQNDWIRACNPVKLKEYLAVGRPVVSTPFEELKRYSGLVKVAEGGAEFAAAIKEALRSPPPPAALRGEVEGETWGAKAGRVLAELDRLGIRPACEVNLTCQAQ